VWSSSTEPDWYTARFLATFTTEDGFGAGGKTSPLGSVAANPSNGFQTQVAAAPAASAMNFRRESLSFRRLKSFSPIQFPVIFAVLPGTYRFTK
jgi:hypothetical protein